MTAWPAAGVTLPGHFIQTNGMVAPLVVGGRVIVQGGTSVYARMVADGAASWTVEIPAGNFGYDHGVSTDGTRVFVVERCEVVALLVPTGVEAWRGRIPQPDATCSINLASYGVAPVVPAYFDGGVYVGTPFNGVAAFDAATGAPRWRNELQDVFQGPAVTETTVVFTGRFGTLQVLDRFTGLVIAAGDEQVAASPATAVGDLLLYRDMQGRLVALDQRDLSVLWTSTALPTAGTWGSLNESRPIVAGGRIYAYANDGTVRAFGPPA